MHVCSLVVSDSKTHAKWFRTHQNFPRACQLRAADPGIAPFDRRAEWPWQPPASPSRRLPLWSERAMAWRWAWLESAREWPWARPVQAKARGLEQLPSGWRWASPEPVIAWPWERVRASGWATGLAWAQGVGSGTVPAPADGFRGRWLRRYGTGSFRARRRRRDLLGYGARCRWRALDGRLGPMGPHAAATASRMRDARAVRRHHARINTQPPEPA